jgi:2-(1,2-epoxy-1,2-dihydrophenyl)acetyl-CoA isomerase
MKKTETDLNRENDYFSARQDGRIIIFSFKGNAILTSTMNKAKEAVLDYFDNVSRHPEADIILILARTRKARREEYLSFFDMVQSKRLSKHDVLRMYRAFDQLILHILSSDVFFINADCGQILSVFSNIALACDYRVIGDNTIFQNPDLELGLVPKGSSLLFVNSMLGRGKTLRLILSGQDITPQEAEELGLIDRIVSVDRFEEEAIKIARQFAALPPTSLRLAKRLSGYGMKGLADCLDFENSELIKVLIQKNICS